MPVFIKHAPLAALAAALLTACSQHATSPVAEPAAVPVTESAVWKAFVEHYLDETFKAQPMFAVQSGRHEYDGRMPDLSRAGIAAEVKRLSDARAAALAFAPQTLDQAQRFEREYLVAELDGELFWLVKAESPFRNPAWYVDQLDPEVYLTREYAPLEKRLSGYIGFARAIPGIVASMQANLRTPLPRTFVERGAMAFGGFADFYAKDVPQAFAAVKDPAAQKELATVNAAAVKAMRAMHAWFIARRKDADDGFALGPELYVAMLHDTDAVDLSVAQIKAAAEADVARNTAALHEACAVYAPGASLADCVKKDNLHKPAGGAVAGATRQLAVLRDFVKQQDLVTVPGDEVALVQEAPPYNRSNSAYIVPRGYYERNVASVFYISPPDPRWSRSEQLEYIDGEAKSLNTSIHEVWPGHFLQFLHSNRATSPIGGLFVGYDFAEGWAHYAEELMWDAGIGGGSPENHIAQLQEALWRDVRLLSSIGLHTEGMTVAESERLFREVAYNDAGNARQQAARGTYDPAYLNYTLGKLEIRKLRDDWIARQLAGKTGGKPRDYWKAFHDQFLSYGGPPIPLVRRAMLPGDTGPPL